MTKPNSAQITALFRGMLDRDPDPVGLQYFQKRTDLESVVRDIKGSSEFVQKQRASPFFHYQSRFDAEALMHKYAVPQPRMRPGLLVNFLDVAVAPKFLPEILSNAAGTVEGIPIPANWHADVAEWGAVLRSIDLARDTFRMAELGCGWGCWINNACVTAKRRGLRVHGIGVEGDEGHIAFAKEACRLNGLTESEVTLHHAIASGRDGVALFPRQERAGIEWGLQAIFDATSEQRAEAARNGTHVELPTLSLESMTGGEMLDFLHIDIQGAEIDVAAASIDFLCDKVAYMMIGTHSRQIEGRLLDLLLAHGWVLEIERPAFLTLTVPQPGITVDGVQGWRNPRLLPET